LIVALACYVPASHRGAGARPPDPRAAGAPRRV